MRRVPTGLMLLMLTLAAVLALGRDSAQASTMTVTTTDDELNADGDCSLREAIQAANTDTAVDACTAGSGADTIVVPAGTYTLSIAGAGEDANASGDLDITADLTLTGAGAATTIIDGADLDRVFHIVGATVEISGVTIQNGFVLGDVGTSVRGGGIFNDGTLTLNNSTVSGNTADAVSPSSGHGGGINNFIRRTATLSNVTVSGNTADVGGGIGNAGGTLTLNSSTIIGNTAGAGGGMDNSGTLTVNESTVHGNTDIFAAGGIHSDRGLTVNNSTVSGNTQTNPGSGGAGGMSACGGTLTNVTVSGNTSASFIGTGGISGCVFSFNTLTVNSSTIIGNTGGSGGIEGDAGNILKNTIVANNTGGNCLGGITSSGHNLSSDGTCPFAASGDLQNTDPLLGPLADNGGPTQTHALLTGSPAIDAGSSDCPPPTADQRGMPRPLGAACDIGAVETTCTPDTDCDGLVDSSEAELGTDPLRPDTDRDGCLDGAELGPNPSLGGGRNPKNFWDFFDTPNPNPPPGQPQRDKVIDIVDIVRVVDRFGTTRPGGPPDKATALAEALGPAPPGLYWTAFDRSFVAGKLSGPPDGVIDVGDIAWVVAQFGHSCAAPP